MYFIIFVLLLVSAYSVKIHINDLRKTQDKNVYYEMPDWVKKSVFKHNKPTKKLDKKILTKQIDRIMTTRKIDPREYIDYESIEKMNLPLGLLQ